jgi:enamine deaminase RidA (YjgF/YER057c/UK114 family)
MFRLALVIGVTTAWTISSASAQKPPPATINPPATNPPAAINPPARPISPAPVKTLVPAGAIKPTGTWNLGTRAGDFIYIAGMRGIDPRTDALVEGDEARVRQAFLNMKLIAESEGASLRDAVRLVVYTTDMFRFRPLVNKVQSELWGQGPYPPRTIVEVFRLRTTSSKLRGRSTNLPRWPGRRRRYTGNICSGGRSRNRGVRLSLRPSLSPILSFSLKPNPRWQRGGKLRARALMRQSGCRAD